MIYSFRNSGFRDPETGVYNQTYFMEVFNREWHRHIREHQSLALLYLRPHIHETVKQPHLLEFFMKQVQEAILRTTDLVARLDDSNFVLGLFNIDEDGTTVVLGRIEEKIEQFNLEYGKQHTSHVDYDLAACICIPERDLNIELLFEDVEKLSHELELEQNKHIEFRKLQQ
ncbi:diguanylate cyclase [Shewanella sp. D64]|uniref:GGDEF domain-containing protein n=1 Tax=unclassified Shewanella TaxID=196818 RepID=UPI0022BA21C0|nr:MULTISPECIES: diguanylate cyclase [unclassified Shewanella]MEC4726008.1 diguanylate cyclase [Shewanella sp. D64]MEC4737263.1 diguanylate cyclase [Shewanella sp. E94]WBJ93640.1 diguanylate cyclase [Shewanella sp. MTB7]